MPMVDPMDGLSAFNEALTQGVVKLHRGEIDKNVFVHIDRPLGETRFTYASIIQGKAVAIVTFVGAEPVGAEPCFGIGYAVTPSHRGTGLASSLARAAMIELLNGLGRNGVPAIHIEAVVGIENHESQLVANKTISKERRLSKDEVSGEPAFQYIHRFCTKQA